MKSDWIADVWKSNQTDHFPANHERFQKHRVPPFYNLHITVTGLAENVHNSIKDLIEKNGGTYDENFSRQTQILITTMNPQSTNKLKYALEIEIHCLNVHWIMNSNANGYALPPEDYRVSPLPPSQHIQTNEQIEMCIENSEDVDNTGLHSNQNPQDIFSTQSTNLHEEGIPTNICTQSTNSREDETALEELCFLEVKDIPKGFLQGYKVLHFDLTNYKNYRFINSWFILDIHMWER